MFYWTFKLIKEYQDPFTASVTAETYNSAVSKLQKLELDYYYDKYKLANVQELQNNDVQKELVEEFRKMREKMMQCEKRCNDPS